MATSQRLQPLIHACTVCKPECKQVVKACSSSVVASSIMKLSPDVTTQAHLQGLLRDYSDSDYSGSSQVLPQVLPHI